MDNHNENEEEEKFEPEENENENENQENENQENEIENENNENDIENENKINNENQYQNEENEFNNNNENENNENQYHNEENEFNNNFENQNNERIENEGNTLSNENYENTIKEANIFAIDEDHLNRKEEKIDFEINPTLINRSSRMDDVFNLINSPKKYNERKKKEAKSKLETFISDNLDYLRNSKRTYNNINYDSKRNKNIFKYKELLNEINMIESANQEQKNKNLIPYSIFINSNNYLKKNTSPELKTNPQAYTFRGNSFNLNKNDLFSGLKYPRNELINDKFSKLSNRNMDSNLYNIGLKSNTYRFDILQNKNTLSTYYNNELNHFGNILGKKENEKISNFPKNNQSYLTTNFSKNLERNKALQKLKNWDDL